MQQNCRHWLYGDRDETINHIISEYSKLTQKEYKTRHIWVEEEINWELCYEFKFDRTNKCYIYNQVCVLENELHKILWDFEIQTDHLISARRPDLMIVIEKMSTSRIPDFAIPVDIRVKLKENEKRDTGIIK